MFITWHEKCEENEVPRIVYWFEHGDNYNSAFSILRERDCISFEEGRKKGLLKKKEGTGSITFNKGLDEMIAAQKKPPCDRVPFVKLKEVYEQVSGSKADRLLAEVGIE